MGKEKALSKSEQKGPNDFAEIMGAAKTPQKGKPETGKIEDSPRTDKNLSVKDRKNKGDEKPEVAERKKGEEPQAQTAKKGQSQREQVMLEFMDSMESEFSIPPERIAEAMTSLKQEDLLKSPEETASQIIQKLGLEPEQESKAEAMYVSMLMKLSKLEQQPIDKSEALKPEMMLVPTHEQLSAMHLQNQGMTPQVVPKPSQANLLTSEKQRRIQLNESLDRLSQKFFLNGQDDIRTAEKIIDSRVMDQTQLNPGFSDKTQPIAAYLDQKSALDLGTDLDVIKNDMTQSLPETTYAIKGSAQNLKTSQLDQLLQNQMNQGEINPSQFMMKQNSADMNSGFEMGTNAGNEKGKDLEVSSSKGESSAGEFFVQPQMMEKSTRLSESSAPLVSNISKPQTANTNIQQIMNQAQYMIKKGGGESIVKLSPEGLGDLHLKVSVNDGKVNLTMATESKETKNLIENSLGDLKNSLGSHNLKVESVKVDVGNNLSSDNNNSNSQSGFKFDQSREQARQFLGNFHEENSQNRGFFHESPALKSYGSRQTVDPLKPSEEGESRARRYTGEGRGNGLNLVA